MNCADIAFRQRQVGALEEEVARLRESGGGAPSAEEIRYRTLFDSIDEGFGVTGFRQPSWQGCARGLPFAGLRL